MSLAFDNATQHSVHPGNERDFEFEFEFELLGNSWQFMANEAKRAGHPATNVIC
jgi:hypothetical protein